MTQGPTPPIPAMLGRYRVLRRIGAGGMAEVFLARSTGAEGIEKVLVVKRILPTFARNVKFIGMFVDEAKVAMRLNHPNIVQVYAFEQVRDQFLLAMEFVDGVDLGRLAQAAQRQKQPMPPGIAAFVVMEAARGLDYAHNRKDDQGQPLEIVHRDVSPQSVLLSYDGVVKLADFGIARAKLVTEDTGVIKGKFSYMSPEQARGERVDRRCDVYALGVLLAELLTGRPMFPGKHGLDALEMVRSGKISLPRQVRPSVPEELDRIVARAVAFDREERFPSARAMAGALGRYLHDQDQVYDATALEVLIAQLAPRQVTGVLEPSETTDESFVESGDFITAHVGKEFRERRHVVVVSGFFHLDDLDGFDDSRAQNAQGEDLSGVFGEIAYKADAVFAWTDEVSKREFRFLLGLGHATAHDSLRAVRLAFDAQEAFHGLASDVSSPPTLALGLSRGIVSTVRDPVGRLITYEPVGRVFEVADLLARTGSVGSIRAASEVHRLARRDYLFDEMHPEDISVGTDAETQTTRVPAYRVLRVRTSQELAGDRGPEGATEGLIGRSEDLRFIHEAYREVVATGRSAFLALMGELGIGKTALVSAALRTLDPPPRVLRAECTFGAFDVPFGVLGELLRSEFGVAEVSTEEEVRAELRTRLGAFAQDPAVLDTIVDGLATLLVPPSSARTENEAAEDKLAAVVASVRMLFRVLASSGPMVLWLDGLQWADTPTVELLGRFLHRNYTGPLLIIFSARSDARMTQLLAPVPRIELGPLDPAERRALVEARFGGARVPAEILEAIVERAGGTPFFLIELVDALLERGVVRVSGDGPERRVLRVAGVPMALPATVEDAVSARLRELPDSEQLAVRWLAVAGGGLDAKTLSDLAGADLAQALESLTDRGLVVSRARRSFDLASAVVRHVAYELTDESDRRRMHRRVGTHLSAADQAVPPLRIARHLERAGDLLQAADAYLAAADAARSAYSNRDALRLYARALQLLPGGSIRRFHPHEARDQILRGMGKPNERRAEIEFMGRLATESGDPALRALALNRKARFMIDTFNREGVAAVAADALEAAEAAGDVGAEIEALRISAQVARDRGDLPAALAACDRALGRAASRPELLAARGSVLAQRSIVLLYLGRLADATQASIESLVIFRRLGLKRNESFVLNGLGVMLASSGTYEDAIHCFLTSIVIDREIGDRFHLGRKLGNVGQLLALLGDVDRAEAFLQRALAVLDTLEDPAGRADTLSALAELLFEARANAPAAVEALDLAREVAQAANRPYDIARSEIARAWVETSLGHLTAAEECARRGIELATKAGMVGYQLIGKATLASLLASQRRSEEASRLCRDAEEGLASAGRVERADAIYLMLGRAWRALGEPRHAANAFEQARAMVNECAARLRDSRLRERYLGTAHVRSVLSTPVLV